MSKDQLSLLKACKPDWFYLKSEGRDYIVGQILLLGMPKEWADLRVRIEVGARILIQEAKPGDVLPQFCPERHIQGDETFCLGREILTASDQDSALRVWSTLRQFVVLQIFAHKTGTWPVENALDHGNAAKWQQDCEAIAEVVGVKDEYLRLRAGQKSWISDERFDIVSPEGEPINERRYCPIGCGYPRRAHRRQIRRHCPHHKSIVELIIAERNRKAALVEYWKMCARNNRTCCQTMKHCPLRESN